MKSNSDFARLGEQAFADVATLLAVLDAAQVPPFGYVVVSKVEDRLIRGAFGYTVATPITEALLPACAFVEQRAGRKKRYVVAELRELLVSGDVEKS